jgi:hypothetical protein
MRMRIVAILAAVAALTGAPSIASGAGNSLSSPTASPTSGTVATVFILSVSYDGKWPATAVAVSVAGLTLPLGRIDGTAERGTWAVSTVLPAGTWTPTFRALAAQGNAATIAGPTVTVADIPAVAATPAPTVTLSPPSRGDETTGEAPRGSGDPLGSIVPDPAPAPGDPETVPSPDAEPASSTITTPSPGASGSEPATASGSEPATASGSGSDTTGSGASRATSSAAPEIPDGGAGGDAPAAPAAPSDPEPDAMPSAAPGAMPAAERAPDEEPEAGIVDDAMLGMVLLLGLSGVATVAIIGSTLLLGGGRRSEDDEVATTVGELGETDTLLERRTVRQAKVRLVDDPIVTAMGVDDQVAARRRRTSGAGQVGSGPGERTGGGR